MKFYEVIFQINEGKYNSFLTIQVDEDIKNGIDDENKAIEEAFKYAEKVLGIKATKLEFHMVDELENTPRE